MIRSIIYTLLIYGASMSNLAKANEPDLKETVGYLNSYLYRSGSSLTVMGTTLSVRKEYPLSLYRYVFNLEDINPATSWKEFDNYFRLTFGCVESDCIRQYKDGDRKGSTNSVSVQIKMDKKDSCQRALDHIFKNILDKEEDPFGK
jgi:hypothetical protein